jgi:tetraacyldisaccharide-1-P 4'-kinase
LFPAHPHDFENGRTTAALPELKIRRAMALAIRKWGLDRKNYLLPSGLLRKRHKRDRRIDRILRMVKKWKLLQELSLQRNREEEEDRVAEKARVARWPISWTGSGRRKDVAERKGFEPSIRF